MQAEADTHIVILWYVHMLHTDQAHHTLSRRDGMDR